MIDAKYKISGHESFPCRYTWLPKAVSGLQADPHLFADDDSAMVALGVGKNMVRAIRFWAQVTGVIDIKRTGVSVTSFGRAILGKNGLDPFLEDIRTLWLIHWQLSTNVDGPLLAWDYLLNRWHDPELTTHRAVNVLLEEARRQDKNMSRVTVEQHFETFLHTYVPTRGRKGVVQEDNLDSPLVELELLTKIGERSDSRNGRQEVIYGFRRDEKPDITPDVFAYCVSDFWQKRHSNEDTLALKELAHGHGSPGQVFKLPEEDIRARVEVLEQNTGGLFTYVESASLAQVRRTRRGVAQDLLNGIYAGESNHV